MRQRCLKCGECCRWIVVAEVPAKNVEHLMRNPDWSDHGYWFLNDKGHLEVCEPLINRAFVVGKKWTVPMMLELIPIWVSRPQGYWIIEGTRLLLTIPAPCRYLTKDNNCIIFDSPMRPKLCRIFLCSKAKGSVPLGIQKEV